LFSVITIESALKPDQQNYRSIEDIQDILGAAAAAPASETNRQQTAPTFQLQLILAPAAMDLQPKQTQP
jgi:hypothetical protein